MFSAGLELRVAHRQRQEARNPEQGRGFRCRWLEGQRYFRAYSGTPFTVTGRDPRSRLPANSQTADQIAPVFKLGGKGPNNPYYDPMSFRDPLFAFTASGNTVYRFGSTGRNILRGPGYWQLSPAIFKNFKIKERSTPSFAAESTNFTNTPIWGNPSGSSANLRLNPDGTLNRSVADPLQNFMSITGATAGRTFRFVASQLPRFRLSPGVLQDAGQLA